MQETPIKSDQKNNNYFVIGLFSILVVGLSGYLVLKDKIMTGSTTQEYVVTNTDKQKTNYKNGTYVVVGNYTSPAGSEEIGVTLTLENGLVSDAKVEPKATHPISMKMQGLFTDNFKQFVVGKSIEGLSLDKVSGSSLTPKGFNDALEKVRKEAMM